MKIHSVNFLQRWQTLMYLIFKYQVKSIAEIGVFKGDTAQRILNDPLMTGANEKISTEYYNIKILEKYYLVDIAMHPIGYELEKKYPIVKVLDIDSVEASKFVLDRSLDLVFIDGDHSYEGAKRDILAWKPKLKIGGILAGHDYCISSDHNCDGPKLAVDELLSKYDLQFMPDDCPNGTRLVFWAQINN